MLRSAGERRSSRAKIVITWGGEQERGPGRWDNHHVGSRSACPTIPHGRERAEPREHSSTSRGVREKVWLARVPDWSPALHELLRKGFDVDGPGVGANAE